MADVVDSLWPATIRFLLRVMIALSVIDEDPRALILAASDWITRENGSGSQLVESS